MRIKRFFGKHRPDPRPRGSRSQHLGGRGPSRREASPLGRPSFASPVRLVLTLATLMALCAGGLAGCDDESDYCLAYCEKAAECLDCGGSVDLDRCQDECVDLTIAQQKKLANCAKDCENILACRQIAGFMPPTPCDY